MSVHHSSIGAVALGRVALTNGPFSPVIFVIGGTFVGGQIDRRTSSGQDPFAVFSVTVEFHASLWTSDEGHVFLVVHFVGEFASNDELDSLRPDRDFQLH